jgi:sugar (pentulose or hexulose) kinase
MCADIFGYPVVTLRSSEGAALGAAIQALATAEGGDVEGLAAGLARVEESSCVEPRNGIDYASQRDGQDRLRARLFTS